MSGGAACGGTVSAIGQPLAGAVAGKPASCQARSRARRWWRAWRARFGLAEVCGSAGAAAGFAAGYLPGRSLVAAAGLATVGEAAGFYGCLGVKAALAAWRATAHLAGWRRLAAGAWHAVRQQLASCAAAEVLDFTLIRPGCLIGAAWLLRPLPGGVWLGLLAGKAVADVIWYAAEASARRAVAQPDAPATTAAATAAVVVLPRSAESSGTGACRVRDTADQAPAGWPADPSHQRPRTALTVASAGQ